MNLFIKSLFNVIIIIRGDILYKYENYYLFLYTKSIKTLFYIFIMPVYVL